MTPSLLKITPELTASVAAKTATAQALLADIAGNWTPAAFANSLGAEDMVLTDLIVKAGLPIEIFSLDTGRLPLETYDLMAAVQAHYGLKLKIYFPQASTVEDYVRANGINAFYESIEMRKGCCYVRKVEPLKRALAGKKAWITGMRAEQAATRGNLATREYDEGNGLEKFNPLADWSEKEVWTYIKQNAVPYNALHDKFYPSIGCAPCTRAISLGEDVRSGRWWWESPDSKECGLHVKG
ncbi:phosphoadenylyl-sulfate reductase [Quatrionicoccus australiensis]|uniref:phosphoadenylyl-sulfate reductase n=1 Tax=Quatrionicoccus australiensis TaxID=138118 RepID=UPI001CFA7095|nr:phosphoadenylyl-sulfate reductase [Quatrionicoccus australiensis]MCB4361447.1 phosphoadenylyl-sulfate reductase [Quatrionicoccus australiensis]